MSPNPNKILRPLEKAFKFYAILYLCIVAFQIVGLLTYIANVWPQMTAASPSGAQPSATIVLTICLAVLAALLRSFLWVAIYWIAAKVFSLLRNPDAPAAAERIVPLLKSLTPLLIASCLMDLLFLPAYFLSDVLLPFSISGWRLGLLEVARIIFPQAFGFAALILAFLTSQYSQLLKERTQMKKEIELTI